MASCLICGASTKWRKGAYNKTCSVACRNKLIANNGHNSGEGNPRWAGGKMNHPLYGVYKNMIQRCENPNHPTYQYYGGRGITIDLDWREDFWQFVKDVGERPDGVDESGKALYSLDRINNNGDYEAGNVRWATQKEQAANRKR